MKRKYKTFEEHNHDIPGFAGTEHDIFLVDIGNNSFSAPYVDSTEEYLISDLCIDLESNFGLDIQYEWDDSEWIININ